MMPQHHVYIETFGCQMNERDSEIMGQLLNEASYAPTKELGAADLIVVNTCSIRGKAEQKAYSLLGRLKKMKRQKPGLVIAVAGCVAQQDGEGLLSRMPFVDLVVGPQSVYQLPGLVAEVKKKKIRQAATGQSPSFNIPAFLPDLRSGAPHKRFVTIMQGCDNFCTYCVVPYTRGREISRSFEDILAEVSHLGRNGVKEITLIGQNVNSYGRTQDCSRQRTFPDLLRAVARVEGIERIRFTTSHPKDLSEELMRCFAEIDVLCPHFHLPVQSGANRILKRMNRKYSIETYLERVAGLRRYRPEIALTTDIIVGFPGETDEDFAATMRLIEEVRYHSAYSFKYSDRPNAASAAFDQKVDEEEKSRRLAILQERQDAISLDRNREFIGKTVTVMVEGASKSADGQWSGRAGTNHIVNFNCASPLQPGQGLTVRVEEACQNSLRGALLS